MKFFTGLIKLARIANHHAIVNFHDKFGYWITNQLGYKLFIDADTGKIWFPTVLRGKNPNEVLPAEFDAIAPESRGEAFYQDWLKQFKNQKALKDIYDGYEFTDNGKKYLERFKKMLIKHKLDEQGLDVQSIDKMLSSNDIDKIRQMAKNIAKKYKLLSEKMKQNNDPLSEQMDKEFYHNWNKLMPLFNYDVDNYKPKIPNPEEIHFKEMERIFSDFLAKIRPLLDVQMNDVDNTLTILAKAIKDGKMVVAKKTWRILTDILVNNVKKHYFHIVGKNSAYILQLSEYRQMHEILFHEHPEDIDKTD